MLRQIRWETAAKIAAGLLLAVAIVVSAPSLLGGSEPAPLPADVGLPQPPAPVPSSVAVPPPKPPKPPKAKRRHRKDRKPRRAHRERRRHGASPAPRLPAQAPPVVAAVHAPPPAASHEDFGFERPR